MRSESLSDYQVGARRLISIKFAKRDPKIPIKLGCHCSECRLVRIKCTRTKMDLAQSINSHVELGRRLWAGIYEAPGVHGPPHECSRTR